MDKCRSSYVVRPNLKSTKSVPLNWERFLYSPKRGDTMTKAEYREYLEERQKSIKEMLDGDEHIGVTLFFTLMGQLDFITKELYELNKTV